MMGADLTRSRTPTMAQTAPDETALPLRLTLDRLASGYRILLEGDATETVEVGSLDELFGWLRLKLSGPRPEIPPVPTVTPPGEDDEQAARDEIAGGLPDRAAFDRIVERHPVPPAWHDEPDWTDGMG